MRNKPLLWKDMIKSGLIYIYQLYQNGVLLSSEQMLQTYGLNIMRYNSLISAIPHALHIEAKNFTNDVNAANGTDWYEVLVEKANLSKFAYDHFIRNIVSPNLRIAQWKKELDCQISQEDIGTHLHDIYKITNIVKYHSFQYRFLHRPLT